MVQIVSFSECPTCIFIAGHEYLAVFGGEISLTAGVMGHGEWGYCFLDGRKLRLGGCIVDDVVGKICFRA